MEHLFNITLILLLSISLSYDVKSINKLMHRLMLSIKSGMHVGLAK